MFLPFQKVHGLGNDFVFLDLRAAPTLMTPALARGLCHRNLGVGADGVLVFSGSVAAAEMTIWNPDGSVPEMCGNGIRCFVMELVRRHRATANPLMVMTGAGPRPCRWEDRGHSGFLVEVDMGPGRADGGDVELAGLAGLADAAVAPRALLGLRVDLGNPHVVFFGSFTEAELLAWGPSVTGSAEFPAGVNAEFAEIMAEGRVRLTVHERGAGFTMACGTGACATVAAGVRAGLLTSDERIEVALPGGILEIVHRSADGHLLMTGPAVEVYEGVVDLERLQTDA